MQNTGKTTISREEIISAESQLNAAMKTSNVDVLDTLLHDDLLFITPDGQTVTKAMDLDSHRAGTMVVEEAEATVERINTIEDTAVVTVLLKAKGKMLGQPLAGEFRYIRVWKRFGNTLKIVGGSCTQLN